VLKFLADASATLFGKLVLLAGTAVADNKRRPQNANQAVIALGGYMYVNKDALPKIILAWKYWSYLTPITTIDFIANVYELSKGGADALKHNINKKQTYLVIAAIFLYFENLFNLTRSKGLMQVQFPKPDKIHGTIQEQIREIRDEATTAAIQWLPRTNLHTESDDSDDSDDDARPRRTSRSPAQQRRM
jgi:hypothetical protein